MGGNAVYGLFSVSTTISCDVCFEKKKKSKTQKEEKKFSYGDKSQEMASISFPLASMSPKRLRLKKKKVLAVYVGFFKKIVKI